MDVRERIRLREPPSRYSALGTPAEILMHLGEAESCRILWRAASDGFSALEGLSARETVAAARRYPRALSEDLRFGAGGTYCHRLFFDSLAPDAAAGGPRRVTAACLCRQYGSVDGFFNRFREEAKALRTGGFLWWLLSRRGHRIDLPLMTTGGYELPPAPAGEPLLALDLWEHAYRPRFGGDRASYAGAFLLLADWEGIETKLLAAGLTD